MLFEDFLSLGASHSHHAVLLISKQFEQHGFPDDALKKIGRYFCDIPKMPDNYLHPDILVIDRERHQLRLEDVQKVKEFCLFPPQLAKRRLIFIENCERLNLNCANFLLKLLEEPGANVLFLLTTAKKYLVLPTILSRLQKFNVFFPSLHKSTLLDAFEKEDAEFLKKTIFCFSGQSSFSGKSLSDTKSFTIKPKDLLYLIENIENLSKKYSPPQLQSLLLHWASERLKKEKTFVIIARFIVAHVREWQNSEPLNPSSQFWLLKILLGHTHENSRHPS